MRKADNLPTYCAVVKKSRSLNFPRPLWACTACYGSALHLPERNSHNSVNEPLEVVRENVHLLRVAGFVLNAAGANLTVHRLRC